MATTSTVYYIPGTSPQIFHTASEKQIVLSTLVVAMARANAENTAFHIGTVDLTSGYNFSSANKNFSIGAIGKTPTTLTLTANCANQAAVVTEINSKITTAGLANDVQAFAAAGGKIGLKCVSAWGSSMTLVAGAQDALTVMGMTAGTYTISMTSGYNFSTNSPTFSVTIGSGTPAVITLSQNKTSLVDTINYINQQLAASFINEVEAFHNNLGFSGNQAGMIGIRAKNYTSSIQFTLAVGTNFDALKILGWVPGTYTKPTSSITMGMEVVRASDGTSFPHSPDDYLIPLTTGQKNITIEKITLAIGDSLRAVASAKCAIGLIVNLASA